MASGKKLFLCLLVTLALRFSAMTQCKHVVTVTKSALDRTCNFMLWMFTYLFLSFRRQVDGGSEVKPLQDFLQWCKRVGLVLSSKVCWPQHEPVSGAADKIISTVLFLPRSVFVKRFWRRCTYWVDPCLHNHTVSLCRCVWVKREQWPSTGCWL